jgi:hypothetical protein
VRVHNTDLEACGWPRSNPEKKNFTKYFNPLAGFDMMSIEFKMG